jgi:hypothetical protein
MVLAMVIAVHCMTTEQADVHKRMTPATNASKRRPP